MGRILEYLFSDPMHFFPSCNFNIVPAKRYSSFISMMKKLHNYVPYND
jgi:hypothetical protein